MLRKFRGTRGYFLEKHFHEREKSSRQASENRLLAEIDRYCDSEGKGIEPLPWTGREPRDFTSDRPQPCCSAVKPAVYFSTATVMSVVCILRQLGHIRKKCWRLANEKSHVR
jgi:hypothetical protein